MISEPWPTWRRVGEETDGDGMRLLLSCPALVATEGGQAALARLLASDDPGDRACALQVIDGCQLAEQADTVGRAYLHDRDEAVAYRALIALPLALQHLTPEALGQLVQGACDPAQAPVPASTDRRRNLANAQERAEVLERLQVLVMSCQAGSEAWQGFVHHAAAVAMGPLVPALAEDEVADDLLAVCEALLVLQGRAGQQLRRWDRQGAALLRAKEAGVISYELLGAFGRPPGQRLAGALLRDLAREASAGAALFCREQFPNAAQPAPPFLHAVQARNPLRRGLLLRQLMACEDASSLAVTELRRSRTRETAARAEAETLLGSTVIAIWQTLVDERVLVTDPRLVLVAGFVDRAGRYGPEAPGQQLLQRALAEQILQADLLALLALSPPSSRSNRVLVEALEARSAVVRRAAGEALALLPAAGPDLLDLLRQPGPRPGHAHALEVLRCLGDARVLEFARAGLETEDELLQAASASAARAPGSAEEFGTRLAERVVGPEIVALAALQGLVQLLESGERTAELLVRLLGHPLASLSCLARALLHQCPREAALTALQEAEGGTDALAAAGIARALQGLANEGQPPAPPVGGHPVPVVGDSGLGQTLLVEGDKPWQWGLPGLQVVQLTEPEAYLELLRAEEAPAAPWEDWLLSGEASLQLLPHVHELAEAGGRQGEAAAALGLDIQGPDMARLASAGVDYHRTGHGQAARCGAEGAGRGPAPRLKAAARRIVADALSGSDVDDPQQRGDLLVLQTDQLRSRLVAALEQYDVLRLEPVPLVPLGTLSMAWEPLAKTPLGPTSAYPERHLSFANLLEKAVRQAIREARARLPESLVTVSLDEPVGADGRRRGR